jgi:hypothetical protein
MVGRRCCASAVLVADAALTKRRKVTAKRSMGHLY